MHDAPFVQSVLHPSDFSKEGHSAFIHALAIALNRRARFDVLHVVTGGDAVDDLSQSPQIRETLERWGLLEPGSGRSAVHNKLALEVAKINIRRKNPVKAILDDILVSPVDLIVVATEDRGGVPRWLKPSVAEGVKRHANTMTLFVPKGTPGFVSFEDGRISLKRVLVAVDTKPSPDAALTYAVRAGVMSHEEPVEIALLHVGSEGTAAWPSLPELQSCTFTKIERQGDVAEQITATAEELSADLIVMATESRKGIFGLLRGSVTEKVMRKAGRPVLAVPAKD